MNLFGPPPIISGAFPVLIGDRYLPRRSLLLGGFEITQVEAMRYDNFEYSIAAKLYAVLEEAHDQLLAPTLPVHDEPAPHD